MGEEDRRRERKKKQGEAADSSYRGLEEWMGVGAGGRERVSEREGQTPQQQAWETSLISRYLENSHNRRTLKELLLSREVLRAKRLFILRC